MEPTTWSGVHSEVLQQRFRDTLAFFWVEASRDPSAAHEVTLAEALQRVFPGARIRVLTCEVSDGETRVPIQGGFSELEQKGALDTAAMTLLIRRHLENGGKSSSRTHQHLHIETRESAEIGFGLGLSSGRQEFWILLDNPLSPEARSIGRWLDGYIPGLRELHAAMVTLGLVRRHETKIAQLQALENSSRLASFRQQTLRLGLGRDENISVRLRQATALVEGLATIDASVWQAEVIEILGELGLWMIQEMFGLENSLQNSAVPLFFASLSEVLNDKLQIYSVDGRDSSGENLAGYFSQLRAFRIIAASDSVAVMDLRNLLEGSFYPEDPLFLLLLWGRWHEASQSLEETREAEADLSQHWYNCLKASLPILNRLLGSGWMGEGARLRSPSAWLNLWLARQLVLKVLDDDPWSPDSMAPFRSWRFRGHLALVLRESIRLSEFGARPDFTFDPNTYLDAMAYLVEQHAHHVVGVDSRLDLANLLKGIGRGRDADDLAFAASHVQHSLQVYVLGHFLAELALGEEAPEGPTLDHRQVKTLLASSIADETQEQFLCAFSLAALLHDIGIVVVPREARPIRALIDHAGITGLMAPLATQHRDSSRELRATCLADLKHSKILKREEQDDLETWLDEHEDVDHSLLGAWYLLRLEEQVKKADGDVIKQAARAILFHQVFTKEISVQDDPVAALLVLCDEIFEWQPAQRKLETAFIDTSYGGAVEFDVRPEGSRAKRILLHGLEARGGGVGDCPESLHWALRISDEDHQHGWPRFELHLKEPDRRNQATWQVWMQTHQNLARVRGEVWRPWVEITGSVPGQLSNSGRNTKQLLDEWVDGTKLAHRKDIDAWLLETLFLEKAGEPDKETMRIEAGQEALYPSDVTLQFGKIKQQLDQLLRVRRRVSAGVS